MRDTAILDRLWAICRIRLYGPLPDVFIIQDHGGAEESVWTGETWAKNDPKRYPSLQAAFNDLPTVLRKSGISI